MMRQFLALFLFGVCLTAGLSQIGKATPTLTEVQSFGAAGNITAAVYSNQYNLLFLRDQTTDIRVLNAATGAQLSLRTPSATGAFTDFAFSPSGQYLFVADYGGTNIGYDTPKNPSFVNRYDLQAGTWTSAQLPGIGYRIAPVDDGRVLLLGTDQWVDLTLNTYAPGSMTQLTITSPGYSGNVEYSSSLNRIFFNETGLSSEEIRAFTLNGNSIVAAETTAGYSYGSALGLLSSDGSAFYYAQKELKGTDLTKTIATFSENIAAASPTVAFGATHYFDAATGTALGSVAFTPLTWTVAPNGRDVWAVEQPSGGSATLHHYVIAQSSLWNTTGGGSWADTAKWNPSGLPDGMDNTANLSQVTLAADATVTLDGNHTVGHLLLGDLGASRNWTVNAGTGGVLTLQVTAGTPNITVTSQTATVNAPIAGTQGLLKDGAGTLVLGAANTYSGGTTISAGTLMVTADNNLGSGGLTINAGTFRVGQSISSSRPISLQNAAAAIQVDSGFGYTAQAGATVSGTGGLTKLGTGMLDLTAATVNYTGTTTVSAGTLNVNSLGSTAQVTVASGAIMNVAAANLTVGPLASSGILNFTNPSGTITVGTLSGTGITNFAAGANIPTLSSGGISVAGAANITTANGGNASLNGTTATVGTLTNTYLNLGFGTALSVGAGTQTTGVIGGAASLTKTTSGTLILGGTNTYLNGTTIAAGTLQIGNGGAAGSIVGDVTDNGVLAFSRSDSYTFGGLISGSGALKQNGPGQLTLTAQNTFTGGTTISGGTLMITTDNNMGSGPLTINAGTFRVGLSISSPRSISLQNAAAAIQVDGGFGYTAQPGATVSGSGGLTKLGGGPLDLTAATVNYTGATTVSAGTLTVLSFNSAAQVTVAAGAAFNDWGANVTLGPLANSGTVTFPTTNGTVTVGTLSGTGSTNFWAGANIPTLSSGTVFVNGVASITTASGGSATLNGATATIGTLSNTALSLGTGTALGVGTGTQTAGGISGAGSLTKTGSGTLILGYANTYSGGTTIAAGTFQIGNGGTTGSIVGNVTDNGVLAFNRSDAYTFGGLISGTGALRQNGPGLLTLTALNTFTGGTTISGGNLQLGDGTVAGTVTGNVTNSGVLTFNTPVAGQTFNGAVSGAGSITKLGPGTQVLTGSNTNSGGTTISAGALQVGAGGTAGSITGNVTNDAALVFKRSDNVTFPGTITGAGRVEQAGAGTLTLSGTVTNALLASAGRVVVGATSTFSGDVTTTGTGRVENGGGIIHVANLDNGGVLSGTADLTGTFVNRATGDVRLAAGQRMLLESPAAHTNAGLVEVLGTAAAQAEFEAVGPFTNVSGGTSLIAARYASLRFDGGLTNQGALTMNYGLSDVFGPINNAAGATIAINAGAGATFYDDVVQNGMLVVSAAGGTHSSAVFLGSVTGSGGITGGGDVFIMGDLRPGYSTAAVNYDANVYLAPMSQMVMDQCQTVTVGGTIDVSSGAEVKIDGPTVGIAAGKSANWNLASGGKVTLATGSGSALLRVSSLQLAGSAGAWGSTVDVNDNKLIIDNANSAVAATTYATVNNQLKQGFDNGAWDGQGIVSTKARTDVNNGVPVTIGVVNNDNGSGGAAFYTTFAGQSVNGTDVLAKYTYFGDADLSGTVDAVDYTFFVAGVQSGGTLKGWEWGDFDYSGTVDAVDYSFFVFGVQGQAPGAPLVADGSGPTSVPEPASLALLGVAGMMLMSRRGRK